MNNKQQELIAVGMSGGVDSSVSALLLQQAGYKVVGVFIKSWEDDGDCPAGEDVIAAASAAEKIGIELESVDFTNNYRQDVFADFLAELNKGRTPNPDVWCNAVIKFNAFADYVINTLGASKFATGHYARIATNPLRLQKAEDENKDQSYFLYRITQDKLAKVVFPLATYKKETVRKIANEAKLANANRAESMGICFIGKRKLKDFLAEYIDFKPGKILDKHHQEIGEHEGAVLYTIGQRQGLNLGGAGEAWYVAAKDIRNNTLTVVQGREDELLYSNWIELEDCHWINQEEVKEKWVYTCRVRHRAEPAPCTLEFTTEQNVKIEFASKQWGIAPGQAAVIYDGINCLGGGTIKSKG